MESVDYEVEFVAKALCLSEGKNPAHRPLVTIQVGHFAGGDGKLRCFPKEVQTMPEWRRYIPAARAAVKACRLLQGVNLVCYPNLF